MHGHADQEEKEDPDLLIHTLIQRFGDPTSQTLPITKRVARHQAAIELLQWCAKLPQTALKIEEISSRDASVALRSPHITKFSCFGRPWSACEQNPVQVAQGSATDNLL